MSPVDESGNQTGSATALSRRWATLSDGDVPEAVLTEAREFKVKGSPSTAAQGLRELVLALQGGVRELETYLASAWASWESRCHTDSCDESGMTPLLLASILKSPLYSEF
jgi:hypothetical protein